MDPEDRALFGQSLRSITELHTGPALDAALRELGWHDALTDHPQDGVGLLFEHQGAANATSSALDDVLAHSLGVAGGGAIVLPPLGKWAPPALAADGRLKVEGVAAAALMERKRAVVAYEAGGTRFVEVASERLEIRPVTGLDPALGLVEVTADVPMDGVSPAPAAPWETAIAAGQMALAHELVGACRTMLRLAREHALEREQFGRRIAGFQAIRHRLAESLVAIEGAQACVAAGWDEGDPHSALLAAKLSKAVAGATARTVGKHAQQVLGGMGYTTEHSLHRYIRRTLVLDQLLGSSRALMRDVGEQLLRTRKLPELLPL